MGIRETLNKNPNITTGATIGIIVIALSFIIYQLIGGPSRTNIPQNALFTVDDGKTWFPDDANKLAPFDKDGKPAYRVYVYKCQEGAEFPAYLERYTDDALAKMKANQGPKGDPAIVEGVYMTGMEVKKPGLTNKWVLQTSPAGEQVRNDVKCPHGKTEGLEPVIPE